MPLVNVEGVGLIDFPEGMSGDQIDAAVKKDILPQHPDIAAKTKRGWGEAATDIGASLIKGVGSLAQLPGQVGQLAGIVEPSEVNTGWQGLGKQLEQFGEAAKSPTLIGKEAVRAQKISQAEGILPEAWAAFKGTVSDPALLTSFFTEQLPNLAGSWGGGLLARGATKALMVSATEQALGKAGIRGAVGTGAVMQGADIGSDTYEAIYPQLKKQGMSDEQANGIALSKARVAALEAASISIGAAFLPGGTTIERALVGKGLPTTGGIVKGALGEAFSEGVEEGGGKFASNVGIAEALPGTSLTKGIGAAAGLGALGGALFGGPAGAINTNTYQEAATKAKETNEPQQVTLRLPYDPNVKTPGTYGTTTMIVYPDGTTAFPSEAGAIATSQLSEQGLKEAFAPQPIVRPETKITEDDIKGMNIGHTNKTIRQAILGKDLTDPAQALEVKTVLEDYLQQGRSPRITNAVTDFLARPEFQPPPAPVKEPRIRAKKKKAEVGVPSTKEQAVYQQELQTELAGQLAPETQNVAEPIEPIRGPSEPSVRVPSERSTSAPGIEQPQRRGVVPIVNTIGQPISGETGVQRTLGAQPLTIEEKAAQVIAQRQAPKGAYNPDIQEPSVSLNTRQTNEYKNAIGNYLEKANYLGAKALDYLAGDMHVGDNLKDAKRAYRGLSEDQKAYVDKQIKEIEKITRQGTKALERHNKRQELQRAIQQQVEEEGPLSRREVTRIPTGAKTDVLVEAVRSGNLNAALNAIAKDTSDTFNILEKLVSNRLLANKGSLPKIEIVPAGTIKEGAAQYNPFTDTVQINEGEVDSHTVLHETVHGFLHSLIQKFEREGAKNKGIADLKALYDFVKEKHPELADRYGMENLTEFASELMSNRDFQEDLAQIPYRIEHQSLFTAFIRAVLNALGLSPTQKLSALARGMMAADQSLAMGRAVQERIVTGQETYPVAKVNRDLETLYQATGAKPNVPSPGPFQSIKNNIGSKDAAKTGISRLFNTAETMFFSSDAALNNAIRKGLEAGENSWGTIKNMMYEISTSQATHAEAVAMQFLQQGRVEYKPDLHKWEAVKVNDSWSNLIQKGLTGIANKYGITLEQANKYANQAFVANRLEGLSKADRDIYSHMTPEQIKAGLQFFTAIPELKALQESWNKVRQNAMDAAVEGGLYNKEQAKELLDIMDYVPFYRIEQLAQRAGPKEYGRGLIDFAKNYKIKGSEQEVADIFDNMERWVSYTVSRAVKNRSAVSLYETAKKLFPNEVTDLRQDERTKKEQNTIDLWVDGNRRKVEFKDPLFVHAFQGIESAAIPHFGAAASVANFLRKNIVLMPLFSISQLSQDSFGAMLTSGLKHPWALPVEVAKEFVKTLRGKSTTAEELAKFGAVGVRDYSATFVRDTAEVLAGLRSENTGSRFKRALENFAMASDNAVRQAIYNMTMQETGGDKAAAIEKAFEIINFKRSGASANIQMLRQVVPFFGAYLQAQNVIYKTLTGKGISPVQRKEAQRVLLSNALKISALAFLYTAIASDDEDYQKMDPTIRDRHLLIPGTSVMLPLRSDLTLLPKLIAEYTYLGMTDNGFTDGKKIRRAMGNSISNAILSPTVAPQMIKPILEVATNHDFFTGRPIVGQGIANKVTEEQYTNSTSELSKFIGSSGIISPVNLDHLIKGYMGTTGGLGLAFTNTLVNGTKEQPRPEKSWQDAIASTPGLSAFVAREYGGADKNDFYELRGEVDKAVTTFNAMKKQGRIEEAKEFLVENKNLIKLNKQVDNLNRQLTKLRDREKQIYELPESRMTAEQKGEEIKRIREMEKVYLSNVHKLRQMAGY